LPFVNIKIPRDGVAPEKKAEGIRRVTQVMWKFGLRGYDERVS